MFRIVDIKGWAVRIGLLEFCFRDQDLGVLTLFRIGGFGLVDTFSYCLFLGLSTLPFQLMF